LHGTHNHLTCREVQSNIVARLASPPSREAARTYFVRYLSKIGENLIKTRRINGNMDKQKLHDLINYIVDQGIKAIRTSTQETDYTLDYLAIFCKNEEEFQDLLKFSKELGSTTDEHLNRTGVTIHLKKPITTKAGALEFLKIRKPDPTRPQRGAPDFKIKNYQAFKEKYLPTSGSFSLLIRKDFEMIELKGVDVLVYFPSKTAKERS
jgi:hypothetical protein